MSARLGEDSTEQWTPEQYANDAGWSLDCVEATARRGVAADDADGLSETECAALLAYCREQMSERADEVPAPICAWCDREAEEKELREALGVSLEFLAAYDPAKVVSKCGSKWAAQTLSGTFFPTLYGTKAEAYAQAVRHKALKREQYDNPASFADIVSVRARKWLARFEVVRQRSGVSELQAAKIVDAEFPGHRQAPRVSHGICERHKNEMLAEAGGKDVCKQQT